jgi:hypothetical protein
MEGGIQKQERKTRHTNKRRQDRGKHAKSGRLASR